MKKYLVPTDFSNNAGLALRYAFEMAKSQGAEVHVLSVLSMPPSTSGITGSLSIRMKEDAQKNMTALIEQMEVKDCVVHPYIREGSTVNTIVDIADDIEAACIVMGTKGSSDVDNVILGSIASKVISKANVPVVAVPKSCEFNGLNKVIYASDFNKSGAKVAEKLLDFSADFGTRIDILHIYKPDVEPPLEELREIKEALSGHLDSRTIKFHLHKNADIREGIVDFIDAAEPDMLAMVTKKRGLIGKIFDPSITRRVAMSVDIPLISYRVD